jgi:alpha-glucosidase
MKSFLSCLISLTLLLCLSNKSAAQRIFHLASSDKKIELQVVTGDAISYSISFNKKPVISPSTVSMVVNGDTLGHHSVISKVTTRNIDENITPLYGKFKSIANRCKELRIDFKQNFAILFRVYNEGVAYRFVTTLPGDIIVNAEEANVVLNGSYSSLFPETPKLTSWELPYVSYKNITSIADEKRAILPTLFTNTSDAVKVIVAESDVRDYPGMYLQKSGKNFVGYWAHYPKRLKPYGGEWGMSTSVEERENYIAQTKGARSFPWRVIILSDDDKNLLTNELIYKLATPQLIKDVSWIKPGKCDWEWWHDAIVKDAGFPTGMKNRSTQLYKHYIDFAADNKLEYTLIDAGWSNFYHLDTSAKHIDIQELSDYGKQKNVGLIVWCNATSLMVDIDKYMNKFESWGLKGIKVDFFDRDDQLISQQMEEIAAKAAKKHLIVNFHGCPKSTGLQRAYPNILNYEAIRGEECSKWDTTSNPAYHLQAAFIRMLGGSLDYTPGSMRNRSRDKFKPIPEGLPETQGTRCHELAMFVLFDQYLAVLCDSPAEYRKYDDIRSFLSAVPVTYDDAKVLAAKLSEYAVIAKKKNNEWYVGAMTDWTGRNITVDFSFLDKEKQYKAEIFKDGEDADNNAESYLHETVTVSQRSKLNLRLASGGGAVIRIYQDNKNITLRK